MLGLVERGLPLLCRDATWGVVNEVLCQVTSDTTCGSGGLVLRFDLQGNLCCLERV